LEKERILEKVEEALRVKRAIATGIGIFGAIFNADFQTILLRRRIEKRSLISSKDLTGKWELPGGAVELSDFDDTYQGVIINALSREIKEETGLEMKVSPEFSHFVPLLPAILKRSSIEKFNIIDWAFVVPISVRRIQITPEYQRKINEEKIKWISLGDVGKIEIVSKRMRYLIDLAITYIESP
jgi:8-oxo-dGTP pyrophosphatase MutT (NUDIX family)